MTHHLEALKGHSRLLIEAELKPTQGDRFYPTNFPDLGAANYTLPNGTEMLLVESTQSMANRLEIVCWDESKESIIEELKGLPYIVAVDENGNEMTNSLLEAHRINSEYIIRTEDKFKERFSEEFGFKAGQKGDQKIDWKAFFKTIFKYDPNSLIHGIMLEEIAGRLRTPRILSAFIEARNVSRVDSGGVKFSTLSPEAKEGEGNVPYHRIEFVAENISAYFNIDLDLIRNFGLGIEAENLLIDLSLFKIHRFLKHGLRLRSFCDLNVVNIKVTRPDGFEFPSEDLVVSSTKKEISNCIESGLFPKESVLKVKCAKIGKGKEKKE